MANDNVEKGLDMPDLSVSDLDELMDLIDQVSPYHMQLNDLAVMDDADMFEPTTPVIYEEPKPPVPLTPQHKKPVVTILENRTIALPHSEVKKAEDKKAAALPKGVPMTSMGFARPGEPVPMCSKAMDKKPAIHTKIVEAKPAFLAKMAEKKSGAAMKQNENKPPNFVKPMDKKPVVFTKIVEKKPNVLTKLVDNKPILVANHPDQTPLVFTQIVGNRPPLLTKPGEKKPMILTKLVERKPTMMTKFVDGKPVGVTKVMDTMSGGFTAVMERQPGVLTKFTESRPGVLTTLVERKPVMVAKPGEPMPTMYIKPTQMKPAALGKPAEMKPAALGKPDENRPGPGMRRPRRRLAPQFVPAYPERANLNEAALSALPLHLQPYYRRQNVAPMQGRAEAMGKPADDGDLVRDRSEHRKNEEPDAGNNPNNM